MSGLAQPSVRRIQGASAGHSAPRNRGPRFSHVVCDPAWRCRRSFSRSAGRAVGASGARCRCSGWVRIADGGRGLLSRFRHQVPRSEAGALLAAPPNWPVSRTGTVPAPVPQVPTHIPLYGRVGGTVKCRYMVQISPGRNRRGQWRLPEQNLRSWSAVCSERQLHQYGIVVRADVRTTRLLDDLPVGRGEHVVDGDTRQTVKYGVPGRRE